jgi:hypothetical protein
MEIEGQMPLHGQDYMTLAKKKELPNTQKTVTGHPLDLMQRDATSSIAQDFRFRHLIIPTIVLLRVGYVAKTRL